MITVDKLLFADPSVIAEELDEPSHVRVFMETLKVIQAIPEVDCVISGGSRSPLQHCDEWADLDLWVMVQKNSSSIAAALCQRLQGIAGTLVNGGRFLPWLGHLVSVYVMPDIRFAIDVGVSEWNSFSSLGFGKTPVLVHSARPLPKNCEVDQCSQVYLTATRGIELLENCVKTRKNLARGYHFDAIEFLSRARRELIRLMLPQGHKFFRPEKRIENELPDAALEMVRSTYPDAISLLPIALATRNLISVALQQPIIHSNDTLKAALERISSSILSIAGCTTQNSDDQ